MVQVYSKKYGVKYIDLSMVPINTDALRIIPEQKAKELNIAAFDKIGNELHLSVLSPLPDMVQEEINNLTTKGYKIVIYMVSHKSLQKAWSRYGDISYSIKTEKGIIDISSDDIQDVLEQVKTLSNAKELITSASTSKKAYRVSRLIELFLYAAYALGSSDVHIEPNENSADIRFRIDGILVKVSDLSVDIYQKVLIRIKLTAGLKINIKNNAQDGRFTIRLKGGDIEIRTSTIPSAYGESIVMRILDPNSISVPLEDLGMLPYFLDILKHEISKPNGMIINTGPTGSGKSTTLFALLKKKISPEIKIITIEDPIEYHVEGVTQTQVNKEKGYTFLSGLRSALRQDPDVLMVGEIRDDETASVAVNSALTGHLVLSTLHTNSAAGAFPRLLDLGIDAKILSTAINLIMAQRLVRKLCPHCKIPLDITKPEHAHKDDIITKIFKNIKNKEKYLPKDKNYQIYQAVGCDQCNGTGYKGRMAIVEGIIMDKKVEDLLKTNPTERELVEGTKHQGILTLKEDAIIKIIMGNTSFDEANRIIDLTEN